MAGRLTQRTVRAQVCHEARRDAWAQLRFAVVLLVVIVVGMELAYCWIDAWVAGDWSASHAATPTP